LLGSIVTRAGLAGLEAPPEASESPAAEIVMLKDWRDAAHEMAAAESRRSLSSLDDANGGLTEVLASLSIAAADADQARTLIEQAVTRAGDSLDRATERAEDLERRLTERVAVEEEVTALTAQVALHDDLIDELRQNRFPDFLLGESVRQLAALASEELHNISDGRYSLAARDVTFEVVDHGNADERRPVETLSGGETFLASLALAIALSRSLTDIVGAAVGSKLESMFIDEGFGTLDAETLEVVIEALERLKDSNRLVGIITHVQALAERIGDGLTVRRHGNASSIQRIGMAAG
jgi:exonuclease SbcC